jgi:hypothetical protein
MTREFIDMPDRIARLPLDARGFPVPKFVRWFNGQPDFRIIDPAHMAACVRHNRCWICGEAMGIHKAFVIGPMCCINRITSEPPSHRECAIFAARNCPFLATPSARRREKNLPEHRFVPGEMISRNPGVACVWMTRAYELVHVRNGTLFRIGAPDSFEFYAHGRAATRAEIDESVGSGFPLLKAAAERDGKQAVAELGEARWLFDQLLDHAVPA